MVVKVVGGFEIASVASEVLPGLVFMGLDWVLPIELFVPGDLVVARLPCWLNSDVISILLIAAVVMVVVAVVVIVALEVP